MITDNSVDKNTPYSSKPLSHKASPFICNTHPFKPKMSRLTFTIHLLLALLLLVASQQHFPSIIKVQAIEAVHFKLKPRQLTSKLHVGDDLPNWVAEKRIHKSSSGPNPVGNRNPPSKQ
ncbi:hypothetical protein POPTR_009G029000v4 [Populus trichocarpa]|uniref:Uncharacterized protein n=1 Tax=Populus trichocarpa TaxID=3694 RepID=B9HPJ1_POPTR|nr:CLAVATA3/ESR (CLE)-related protein 46 [Populus trichocarpa]PNT19263.1 hypothetical protein POPTR_009G029000v4 [Populus trichocarpa]|eukprot:XP_002314191.2 CLAVATA3/ESR (CLE)-related protein 46 [Populus trichocarpa]